MFYSFPLQAVKSFFRITILFLLFLMVNPLSGFSQNDCIQPDGLVGWEGSNTCFCPESDPLEVIDCPPIDLSGFNGSNSDGIFFQGGEAGTVTIGDISSSNDSNDPNGLDINDQEGVLTMIQQSGFFHSNSCGQCLFDKAKLIDQFNANLEKLVTAAAAGDQEAIDALNDLEEQLDNVDPDLTLQDFKDEVAGEINAQDFDLIDIFNSKLGTDFTPCGIQSDLPENNEEGMEISQLSESIGGLGGDRASKGDGNPSPSTLAMINDVKAGVGLYNGSQTSSIPLYNYSSNDISIPISISSTNNGLKVNDFGGLVGMNWNLNAGGQISRVVKGLPDEYEGMVSGMGLGKRSVLQPYVALSNVGMSFYTPKDKLGNKCIESFEKKVEKGIHKEKSFVLFKMYFNWSPKRARYVNVTLKLPVFKVFGIEITIDMGAVAGIDLNEEIVPAVYEEEGLGFYHLTNTEKLQAITGFSGLSIDDVKNGNNKKLIFPVSPSEYDEANILGNDDPKSSVEENDFFAPGFARFRDYVDAIQDAFGSNTNLMYHKNSLDTEPDEFYFSVPGYSGKFYFGISPNNELKIITFPAMDGLEITMPTITDGHISSFTIRTPNGMEYLFGNETMEGVELTEKTNYFLPNYYTFPEMLKDRTSFGGAQIAVQSMEFRHFIGGKSLYINGATFDRNYRVMKLPKFSSAWHLLNVKSTLSQEEVFLSYEPRKIKYNSSKEYSYTFPNFHVSGLLLTKNNPDIHNPLHNTLTSWKNGTAEFAYSLTESVVEHWRLKQIGPNRGELVEFVYEDGKLIPDEIGETTSRRGILLNDLQDGDFMNDQLLSEIHVMRGSDGLHLYKGWRFHYNFDEKQVLIDCNKSSQTIRIPEYTATGEAVFNLGSMYQLAAPERRYERQFYFTLGLGKCHRFSFPLGFNIVPYLTVRPKKNSYSHYSSMSEFGSIMTVKKFLHDQDESFPFDSNIEEREKLIFQEEGARSFLSSIDGINTSSESYPFVTSIEYSGTDLPKRFSLDQDQYGYANTNTTKSPFPEVEYSSILNTNVTKDDDVGALFGFTAIGGMDFYKGQSDPTTESSKGAISSLEFASGASYSWGYEPNRLDAGTLLAGVRVKHLTINPNGAPEKSISYSYLLPSVVAMPNRISQNRLNVYRVNGIDVFEQRVTISSSPLSPVYSNGSNLVGYGEVVESILGQGKIVHKFISPNVSNIGADVMSIELSGVTYLRNSLIGSSPISNRFHSMKWKELPPVNIVELSENVLGKWSWKLGLEKETIVYKKGGDIRRKMTYIYQDVVFDEDADLEYWRRRTYRYKNIDNGTYIQNYITNSIKGVKRNWDNQFDNVFLNYFVNVLKNQAKQMINPFKRISKDYLSQKMVVSSGFTRLESKTIKDYFYNGGKVETNVAYLYEDDLARHSIPTTVTTTKVRGSASTTTVDNALFPYQVLNEGLHYPYETISDFESAEYHYHQPLVHQIRIDGVPVKSDYTSLRRLENDLRFVPFENWSLFSNGYEKMGKFGDFNADALPQEYRVSEFGPDDNYVTPSIGFTWNEQRQLLSRQYGDFSKVNTYDDFFVLSGTTDENGIQTDYIFDKRWRLKTKNELNGLQTTSYSYNVSPSDNSVTSTLSFTDGNHPAQLTKQTYTGFGSPLSLTRLNDGTTLAMTAYDVFSRKVSEYKMSTGATTYRFEDSPISRHTVITDAVGNMTDVKELVSDNPDYFLMTSTAGPNNSQQWTHFDGLGKKVELDVVVSDGEVATTKYTYDGYSRLTGIENPIGENYIYDYNLMNKVKSKTVPHGGTTRMWYDNQFRLVGTIDAEGNEFVNDFDIYGRTIHTYLNPGVLNNSVSIITNPCANCPDNTIVLTNGYANNHTWLETQEERIFDALGANITRTSSFGTDNFGRVVSSQVNMLDRTLVTNTIFDNANLIVSQGVGTTDFDAEYVYGYDDVLRPTTTKLNDYEISKLSYTSRDQVKQNQIGKVSDNLYLQDVDYGYDATGKLLHINSPFTTDCSTGEVCKLFGSFVVTKNNAALSSIVVNDMVYSTPPFFVLDEGGAANKLKGFIEDAIDYNGLFGDVTVSAEYVFLPPGVNYLKYTIIIENTNVTSLSFFAGAVKIIEFEKMDCCSVSECPSELPGFDLLGEFEGHKYFISQNTASWFDAQVQAQAAGGYLTSITSTEENTFLYELVKGTGGALYIGYNDIVDENISVWDNGEDVTIDLSEGDGPENDFGALNTWNPGRWSMFTKWTSNKFIMEFECGSTPTVTGGDCTGNTDLVELGEFEGHKYFISQNPARWFDAQAQAHDAGGYLASITSTAENLFLYNLVKELDGALYIGYNDIVDENIGAWDNGEDVTIDLSEGDGPENDFGALNTWNPGNWSMFTKWTSNKFIVEFDCGGSNTNPVEVGVDLFAEVISYNELNIDKITYSGDCSFSPMINNFEYDRAHRITKMMNVIFNPNRMEDAYSTSYSYDLAGNILTLDRRGFVPEKNEYRDIDKLEYTYNPLSGRELQKVTDMVSDNVDRPYGFRQQEAIYGYDMKGRMTDKGGVGIAYNPIDLPQQITGIDKTIYFNHTFQGQKVRKYDADPANTRIYFDGFEYLNGQLESYSFSGGRIIFKQEAGNTVLDYYEFKIADHLGNLAVTFREQDNTLAVLQRHFYYPFGMNFDGIMPLNTSTENRFQYNGKELEKGAGIDLSDYGARWYDASIGRFTTIDRFAEKYAFQSPYAYAINNPIEYIDVNGDSIQVPNNKYREQTLSDLALVYATSEGKRYIDALMQAKHVYTIDGGAWVDNYSPLTREINYKQKAKVADGVETPSYIELGHEIAHAFQHNGDKSTIAYIQRGKKNQEGFAVKFGNYLREVYSKGFREYYTGLGRIAERKGATPTNNFFLKKSNVKVGRVELSKGYWNQTIRHFESIYKFNGKWIRNYTPKPQRP